MFKVDNTGCKIAMSFFGLDDTLQATFQNPQLNPNADLKNCLIRPYGPPSPAELEKDCSGDPKGPYCTNLGHKMDDESGLIYMRARYYESTSGRFISEDPEKEGSNWVVYCGNNPVCTCDGTGRVVLSDSDLESLLVRLDTDLLFSPVAKEIAVTALMMMEAWLAYNLPRAGIQDFASPRKFS